METISIYDISSGQRDPDKASPLVEIQQDVCRHVINTEIMMLYGHDVDGYLPPLPPKERPRTSLASAWGCSNQAVRQLGNVARRGPRSRALSASLTLPDHTTRGGAEKPRPHTSYCSHVRNVLNMRPSDVRPSTAGVRILDRANDRRLRPVADPTGLIVPKKSRIAGAVSLSSSNSSTLERLGDVQDEGSSDDPDFSVDVASTIKSGGGMRKPRWGMAKKKLTKAIVKPTTVTNVDLNENISRVLRGDLSNLPDQPPTEVKIYLCSHPQDMQAEKVALERDAYPDLREYCQRLGLDFYVVDDHLPGSGNNPTDLSYHLRHLQRCQRQSVGPNLVLLLGDMYGPAGIPTSLTVKDYKFLYKSASVSGTVDPKLFDESFVLEQNIVPPVYVLKNPESLSANRCKELRYLFKQSVFTCIQIGKFRKERENEFDTSVLEHIVKESALKTDGESPAMKCLCLHRKFVGIQQDLENEKIADYIDVTFKDGKVLVDKSKQARLDSLATELHGQLGEANMKGYELSWNGKDIDGNQCEEHEIYLKQIVKDFVDGVKRLIDLNYSKWSVKNKDFPLYREILQHSRVCANMTAFYSERHSLTHQIKSLIFNKELSTIPIVLVGDTGVGKTSLMCHIAKTASSLVSTSPCVSIYHQIGLTTDSKDLRKLISNICQQLSINYNIEPPTRAETVHVNSIVRRLSAMLEVICKHHAEKKPLFILLDDIHKLTSKDRADTFFWLPRKCPKNIFFIMGCAADATTTLSKLEYRGIKESNLVNIPHMTSKEARVCADMILNDKKRKVSEDQMDVLQVATENGADPLLLNLHCHEMLKWGAKNENNLLSMSFQDAFANHLSTLQNIHGPKFIKCISLCLCMVPYGITESELADILITNSEVIKESQKFISAQANNMYAQLKTCVNRTLEYLNVLGLVTNVSSYGRILWSWSSDVIVDIVRRLYCEDANTPETFCKHLLELFGQEAGVWLKDRDLYKAFGYCFVTPHLLLPVNKRKLQLLPHFISQCENIEDEPWDVYLKGKCLCNFQWLLNKLQGASVEEVLQDFRLLPKRELEVDLIQNFITMCGFGLDENPISLSLQLLGTMPHMNASRYPLVAEMIETAREWMMDQTFPQLVPVFQCFPSPLNACKDKLWDLSDVLMVQPDTNLGVVLSKDGVLEIWDMINKDWVYQLGVQVDKVTQNIFCSAKRVMAINSPYTLQVRDIESGFEIYNVDLESIFGDTINSVACQGHSDSFDKAAFHISDDDFNQAIVVLDSSSGKQLMKNDKFDVKDEFFNQAAKFVTIEDSTWMLFVNARSEIDENDKSSDFVKLNVYNLDKNSQEHTLNCGTKKFHKLHIKDGTKAVLSWMDCSFDVYDIQSGSLLHHLPSPKSGLVVQDSIITDDEYLVALAATLSSVDDEQSRLFHGLWVWNIEDESQSELFTQTHTTDEHIPKHFIIIEDLHLAVLGVPELAQISIWDLPTSKCIHTTEAHTEGLHQIRKSPDPYKIYTCSSTEKVVKMWDLYNLVTCVNDTFAEEDIPIDGKSISLSSRATSASSIRSDGTKTAESILRQPSLRVLSGSSLRAKSVRFAEDVESQANDEIHSTNMSAQSSLNRSNLGSISPTQGSNSVSEWVEGNETEALAEESNYCSSGQVTMHSQLECMYDVTIAQFTQDSEFVVTASQKTLPTVWDVKTGSPCLHVERQSPDDIATPWISLVCKDKYIIGTTANGSTDTAGTNQLKLQAWARETGKAHRPLGDEDKMVLKCIILSDGERILVSILHHFNEGDKAEVELQILHVETFSIAQRIFTYLPNLPATMQTSQDAMYTILLIPDASVRKGMIPMVYNMEDPTHGEYPQPCTYEYMTGSKYKTYSATSNLLLRNGISLASGMNGDLQLWDIRSGDYEGNLYFDPGVKEKSNPSLHNHGGKPVNHMVVTGDGRYLVCGGGDGRTTVWDLENEVQMHVYGGHKDEVVRVAVSWDNHLVLTAGADRMLYVWPFCGDRPLCLLYTHVLATDIQLAEDKRSVCVVGQRTNEPHRFMMFRLMNLPGSPT